MQMRLEVVQVLISDVDRAKRFYADNVGFHVDHDTQLSDDVRVVQLTPPGSACSIVIGRGLSEMKPGSLQAPTDGQRHGRDSRLARRPWRRRQRCGGSRSPGAARLQARVLRDPDGNGWTVQEIPDEEMGER